MSDFQQRGAITTLHPLFEIGPRDEYLSDLGKKLTTYSNHQKIGLLLPCHFSDIEAVEVISNIIQELQKVDYLHVIAVALGGTDQLADFERVRQCFRTLESEARELKVVWVSGPRVQQIISDVGKLQIPTGVQGKGQSVWAGLGYLFARRDTDVIALHDTDIVTYDRLMLGRLVEPVANPNNDYEFCKGYYPRISPGEKAMKGRVTRLFVFPFVDAMVRAMHDRNLHELESFFRFHQAFKYPLAGEFCFSTRLARGINIAHDWGLEVSTLSEVYRRIKPSKVAQIDLGSNYEHKHQLLSPGDQSRGLHRMVIDITKFFFHYLRSHGVPLDDSFVEMVSQTYYENSLRLIKCYSDDAEVNNLVFDRYQEELMARYFRKFLMESWNELKSGESDALIPSWNRVLYSVKEIYPRLKEAVEKDNDETTGL
jgi:glucosyl-3-phosphoglycerate synthase